MINSVGCHLITFLDAAKFGQTYLSKLGWDSSKGLGVAGDGRTSHIKVSQKLDMLGIGAATSKDPNGIAWKQSKDFEALLRRLNENTQKEDGMGPGGGCVKGEEGPLEFVDEDTGKDEKKRKRKKDRADADDKKEKKRRKKEKDVDTAVEKHKAKGSEPSTQVVVESSIGTSKLATPRPRAYVHTFYIFIFS